MAKQSCVRLGAVVLGLGLAAGVSSPAQALEWGDVISMANTNRDVGVTMDEATSLSERDKQFVGFAPWLAEHMNDVDTNNDGMISMEEMKAWMETHQMSGRQLMEAWYKQKL